MKQPFLHRNSTSANIAAARSWLAALLWSSALAGLVAVAWIAFGERVFHRALSLRQMALSTRQSDEIPAQIQKLTTDANLLDSVLTARKSIGAFDPTAALKYLYAMADSAGCAAARVEMHDQVVAGVDQELPVTITGKGEYQAIGRFTAAIEGMPHATRLRQVLLNKTGKDGIDFTIDFVVML